MNSVHDIVILSNIHGFRWMTIHHWIMTIIFPRKSNRNSPKTRLKVNNKYLHLLNWAVFHIATHMWGSGCPSILTHTSYLPSAKQYNGTCSWSPQKMQLPVKHSGVTQLHVYWNCCRGGAVLRRVLRVGKKYNKDKTRECNDPALWPHRKTSWLRLRADGDTDVIALWLLNCSEARHRRRDVIK